MEVTKSLAFGLALGRKPPPPPFVGIYTMRVSSSQEDHGYTVIYDSPSSSYVLQIAHQQGNHLEDKIEDDRPDDGDYCETAHYTTTPVKPCTVHVHPPDCISLVLLYFNEKSTIVTIVDIVSFKDYDSLGSVYPKELLLMTVIIVLRSYIRS